MAAGLRGRRAVALALLALVAALAWAPALGAGFLADDFILLRTLGRYDGPLWAFAHNDLGGGAGHFYRPLWVLWHAAIDRASGTAPGAFHAGNLALAAVLTLEVWALVRRLAGEWAAWVGALGFALYPRHGESVAWISGSTDLLAGGLALGSLLAALSSRRAGERVFLAAGLAAAAAFAKESAFVLPLLAAVVLAAAGEARRRWLLPAAMAAAQLGVLAARTAVVGGAGGYSEYPWSSLRALGVAGSYVLAALSPPQLQPLRHAALLVVPAALLALAGWRCFVLWRAGERTRLRLALCGGLWFTIAIVPALNLAVDLNTANGERLLLLPSVGLALVLGALAPAPGRRSAGVLAAVGVGALALCLLSARDWPAAQRLASEVVADASDLGPPGGELVLVTAPVGLRTAHVFPGATLRAALERHGRADLRVAVCIPVHVRSRRAGSVTVERRRDGGWDALTTWDAPFDVPVLRDATPLSPDCSFEAGDGWPPGLEREAVARPTPSVQPAAVAYFNGDRLLPSP
ncbi:MAG: hypothetical protein ABR583_13340 [Gaiellaceae bacterium]